MVDLSGRKGPRFPQSLVDKARKEIGAKLDALGAEPDSSGFASSARGGDTLFHEECRSRAIKTVVVLPFAPKTFVETSVEGLPDTDWVDRFWRIWNKTLAKPREVLALPVSNAAYGARNERLLELTRAWGKMHLIVICDGKGGDGPGGTADLVKKAREGGDYPDSILPASLKPGEPEPRRR
jgi:hypothetical protein